MAAFFCMTLPVTETKESISVSPICICTVSVKQIESDSLWFAPQLKASIAVLKLHSSCLYPPLVALHVSSRSHPSSSLHCFCTSLYLPSAVSSVYPRDTRSLLFNIVFYPLISLTVFHSETPCLSCSMLVSAAEGNGVL